jgi:predicted class III extradiol MEMO1 family dioxygenase
MNNFIKNFTLIYANFRGTRFSYTYYYPEPAPSNTRAVSLTRASEPTPSHPIHESIRRLDHEAIESLTLPPSSAVDSHDAFAKYLAKTKNTICGRHPIGVLLGALATLERDKGIHPQIKWVRYEQSSACLTVRDSSVSYASAWVKF